MEMKKRSGNCTEEIFWECVAEINWASDPKYNVVKRACLLAWTPEFGESFDEVYRKKHREVSTTFNYYEREELSERQRGEYGMGDDSYGDFCSHVVGLGKEVFEAETQNPELLYKRACDSDFRECFGYCLPYTPTTTKSFEGWAERKRETLNKDDWEKYQRDDRYCVDRTFEEHLERIKSYYRKETLGDWSYITDEHYFFFAKTVVTDLGYFLEEIEGQPLNGEESRAVDLAIGVRDFFQLLLESNREEALEKSEEALASWWALYHIAQQGELRQKHAELLPMISSQYGGENYINDYRNYIGGLPTFKCRYHLNLIEKKAS